MKKALAFMSVFLLLGGGAFVVWTSQRRSEAVAPQAMNDFNLDRVEEPKTSAPDSNAVHEEPQAKFGPRFGRIPESKTLPPRGASAVKPAPAGFVSRQIGVFNKAMAAAPGVFLAKQTFLGRPAQFRAFLSDARRVKNYVTHPIVRAFLDSPAALKTLVFRPSVVQGFLSTPAMRDSQSVSALAQSDLLKEVLNSPGVQGLLQDPAVVTQLLANPQTLAWLTSNPSAMQALTRMAPALAAGLGRRR